MNKDRISADVVVTRQFLLYLGGPITGLSWDDATDWREVVIRKLPPHIIGVSPLRAKRYLHAENSLNDSYEAFPLSSKRGIAMRDFYDVERCDGMLFNFLEAKKISIGSILEIGGGAVLRKPIVVVMEEENIHQHSMVNDRVLVVPDLEQGITVACALISPI